jgi:hypothetical protein
MGGHSRLLKKPGTEKGGTEDFSKIFLDCMRWRLDLLGQARQIKDNSAQR